MDPSTNTVIRPALAHLKPSGLRQPTQGDWQKWRPMITARYKTSTVRMIIQEMEGEGLRVTEKMVRDRLRHWGINCKNRRSSANRIARHTEGVEEGLTVVGSKHPRDAWPDGWLERSPRTGSLYDPLHMSKELRLVYQAVKGIVDWQQDFRTSERITDPGWNPLWLRNNLITMGRLNSQFQHDFYPQSSLSRLKRESAMFQGSFRSACGRHSCTPLTVLMATSAISVFAIAGRRAPKTVFDMTRNFLLQVASESLTKSHPTLLLFQLLLSSEYDLGVLAPIYRLGCDIISQFFDESSLEMFMFKVELATIAVNSGRGAGFDEYDSIAENEGNLIARANRSGSFAGYDSLSLVHGIALLHHLQGHHESTIRLAEAPLRQKKNVEVLDDRDLHAAGVLYRLLSWSQHRIGNLAGEERSLQIAVKIARLLKPEELDGASSQVTSQLFGYYKWQNSTDKREGLRIEYASAS